MIPIFNQIKQWFKTLDPVYLPAIIITFTLIGSFLLSDFSSITLAILCFCTVLMTVFIYLTKSQKISKDLLPEGQLSVPSFMVLASGEIKSSNKLGIDFTLKAKGQLKNLLINDGFNESACYRLLNVTQDATHIEKSYPFTYKSRLLENDMVLIIRYEELDCDDTEIDFIDDFSNTEEENIEKIFENLPFGYFKKIKSDILSPPKNTHSNNIIAMNKTLREWVDKDKELLNHIKKFGSETSRISLSLNDDKNKNFNPITTKLEDFFSVFEVPSHTKKDKNLIDGKVHGFVLPIQKKEKEKENNIIESSVNISAEIFKNSPTATIIIDSKHQILDYNQAFLTLFNLTEIQDKNLINYFPESERSKFSTINNQEHIEILFTNPQCILKLTLCGLSNTSQKVCYFRDLSNEKSLEEKFNQAQKMQAIGQLAGGVAHDFNNLLTAIGGHTELLMNRFSHADHAYSDLLHIRNNVNRAGNLVRQLLAFSRRQTLKPQIIILTDILPDLSRMIERLIGDPIKLETNYAPSLKPIKADITQLEQVIINLSVNARDAMRDNGGTLTIKTENISPKQAVQEGHNIMPANDYVKIIVSDTGHGMNIKTQEKIFEPFFTTKPQGEGTGLGLSTVYGIVKQSGGFIFVDSEENNGTHFRIYFPVTQDTEKSKLEKADTSEVNILQEITFAPHTKNILVVEDEESVRSFVVRALELKGYQVFEADCGEDALEIFKEKHQDIHLVITDVMMPGLSGPEWIKKAQLICNEFSVIFMSGYTQEYFREDKAFEEFGLEILFLSKPFSLKDLNNIVKSHIK